MHEEDTGRLTREELPEGERADERAPKPLLAQS